jgi:hypothetical protein
MSDRDKDVEIVVLRHQITVLKANRARLDYGSRQSIEPSSRHPQRIPPCRLTSTDGIFG